MRVVPIEDEADAEQLLGCVAFPAPTSKERYGFNLVAPPKRGGQRSTAHLPTTRRVAGTNDLLYDTEKAHLRVRLSLARFNASKRVRGASVGAPPEEEAKEQQMKFSLLERKWVPKTTKAPTPAELNAAYAVPAFAHWE
jgi:hypothetical protein